MSAKSTAKPTRERVAAMQRQRRTPRQIALALGISTQAVYKHLKALDAGKKKGAA